MDNPVNNSLFQNDGPDRDWASDLAAAEDRLRRQASAFDVTINAREDDKLFMLAQVKDLTAENDKRMEMINQTGAPYQIGINPVSVVAMRLVTLIEELLGNEESIPRARFELRLQAKYAEALDEIEQEIRRRTLLAPGNAQNNGQPFNPARGGLIIP